MIMITLKKRTFEIVIKDKKFDSIQDTSDGFYLKLSDGSEIRINCEVTPVMKMIPMMVQNSKMENITVDFDNLKNPITFS